MKKILLIVVMSLTAFAAGIVAQQNDGANGPFAENGLADIVLPDMQGKQRSLAEWQGKVLIVNFWATWCPPCLKEIPEFIALQNEYGDQGLQFVGIAIEDREPVAQFLQAREINYPILLAEETGTSISVKLGNIIQAVPYSVIIDRAGNIVHGHPGELSGEKIVEVISPLL